MNFQPEVTLNPTRHPWVDRPNVTRDFTYQHWTRGEEEIRIEAWYGVKESPSGGFSCTLRLSYVAATGERFSAKGRAGGYGYCKFSSAFGNAFRKLFPDLDRDTWAVDAAGESVVYNFLVSLGFKKIAGGQ